MRALKPTGLLTMLNTTGAMLGSILAGMVLLPHLGMEKSLFALSPLLRRGSALHSEEGRRCRVR